MWSKRQTPNFPIPLLTHAITLELVKWNSHFALEIASSSVALAT